MATRFELYSIMIQYAYFNKAIGQVAHYTDRLKEDVQACDAFHKSIWGDFGQAACRTALRNLGISLGGAGYSFAGNYDTKGCYYYEKNTKSRYSGMGYYGLINGNDVTYY